MYSIEIKEAGVWNTVDEVDNLTDALMLASSYVHSVREEWIQIVTPEGKIL